MSQTSFYSEEELSKLGFKSIGKDCKISRNASFYGVRNITIGDSVRIDDFSIISGNVNIESFVHISAYVALYGSLGINIKSHSGISSRSTIYSAMDDFSGDYLIGPMQPKEFTNVTGGLVTIGQYSQIGANCIIFPNLSVGEGSVVGACSMVRKSIPEWEIHCGYPAKYLKNRSKKLLDLIK